MEKPLTPKKIDALSWLLVGLVLWQLIVLSWLVKEYYLPGPVQDSWGILPYLQDTLKYGHWFDRALLLPQNGHRLLFLRLEYLIDYSIFHGSNVFLIAMTSASLLAEIACFYWLLVSRPLQDTRLIHSGLLVTALVLFPSLAWSYQHIFNIHMVHCALFALASCVVMAEALAQPCNKLFLASLLLAVLCNFASFSISTIWPALLFMILLQRRWKSLTALAIFAVFFSIFYLVLLPSGNSASSNFDLLHLLAEALGSAAHWSVWITTASWLASFIVTYLSFLPAGSLVTTLVTICSLLWFVFGTRQALCRAPTAIETAALGIMAFCVCLAITTGIARGALGDLSYGMRFQPLVLLYWAGFILHIMQYIDKHHARFHTVAIASLAILLCYASVVNAIDTGKRLSEDYTRFARMQMAYLTHNLGENAIYENMVAEWRKDSYSGIVAIIPFLEQEHLGIFNTDFGKYLLESREETISKENACFPAKINEKPRNEDPFIRNIIIESSSASAQEYPYVLVMDHGQVIGAAFTKRKLPFRNWFQASTEKYSWLGITSQPLDRSTLSLLAFRDSTDRCRLTVAE
jgi:hypothetical protein